MLHGDDPCLLPDGTDAYAHAKKLGRFKMVGAAYGRLPAVWMMYEAGTPRGWGAAALLWGLRRLLMWQSLPALCLCSIRRLYCCRACPADQAHRGREHDRHCGAHAHVQVRVAGQLACLGGCSELQQ